jgi:hypothetical protein
MSKIADYRNTLRACTDWDAYLLSESGLPGPRANLELLQAVADEGDEPLFRRYLAFTVAEASVNTPKVFLTACGVVGLGRLLAEGRMDLLETLHSYASDPRWRIRECVAMALQRLGDSNMPALLQAMAEWSQGNPLEQRAAAAALCEPRLLHDPAHTRQVLQILDGITTSLGRAAERKGEAYRVLKEGLGYCWSVAVVALPEEGKALMEKWLASEDKDIRWVMRENLKKNRLARLDAAWVERWKKQLY